MGALHLLPSYGSADGLMGLPYPENSPKALATQTVTGWSQSKLAVTTQNPMQRLVVSRVPSSGSVFYHIGISCLKMSRTGERSDREKLGREEREGNDNFES